MIDATMHERPVLERIAAALDRAEAAAERLRVAHDRSARVVADLTAAGDRAVAALDAVLAAA